MTEWADPEHNDLLFVARDKFRARPSLRVLINWTLGKLGTGVNYDILLQKNLVFTSSRFIFS